MAKVGAKLFACMIVNGHAARVPCRIVLTYTEQGETDLYTLSGPIYSANYAPSQGGGITHSMAVRLLLFIISDHKLN